MKILNVFCLFAASFFLSFPVYGQQMPVGNVMSTVSCSLNDGVGMGELVRWFRANPRNPDSTNLVFIRQPLVANSTFTDNYDFRIATYYGSYDEYISQREARRGGGGSEPRVLPTPLPRDMFTCDFGALSVALVRNIPDGDPFTGDDTLLTSRLCFLNEGSNVGDAYNFVAGIAAGFSRGGDNALMQVSTRAFGPIQNATAGRAVVVSEVSSTADSMASRLDLTREGLNVAEGLENVMACNYPSLWRTHAVYRPDN